MSKRDDDEKYKGPGHLASAYGDAALYSIGGLAAGAAVTGGAAHVLINPEGKTIKATTKAYNDALGDALHDTLFDINLAEIREKAAAEKKPAVIAPLEGAAELKDPVEHALTAGGHPGTAPVAEGMKATVGKLVDEMHHATAELKTVQQLEQFKIKPHDAKTAIVLLSTLAGAAVLSGVGALYGAAHGWGKASKGRHQFETMKHQRDVAITRADTIAEMTGRDLRPRGSYADAVLAEAAAQGEKNR